METIKFRIIKYNDMCRIEANDIRGTYRTIAPRGCICSLDIMLEEMERITKEVKQFGNNAIFTLD